MKTKIYFLILFLSVWMPLISFADNDYHQNIKASVRQSVENAIAVWLDNDSHEMQYALESLSTKEGNLLMTGDCDLTHYYIARTPDCFLSDINSLMANIYILYQTDKGIDLRPESFFKGQTFTYIPKKEAINEQ